MASNFSDYEDLLNAYANRTKSGDDGKLKRVDYDPQEAKRDRKRATKRPVRHSFSDTARKRTVNREKVSSRTIDDDSDMKIASFTGHMGSRKSGSHPISNFHSDFDDILNLGTADAEKTTVARNGIYSKRTSRDEQIAKRRSSYDSQKRRTANKGKRVKTGNFKDNVIALMSDIKNKNLIIYFAVLAVLIVIFSIWGMSCVNDILAMNRSSDAVTITINTQVDTNDVMKMLKKNKLIHNKGFCKLFAKYRGFTDEYQTGVFYLRPDMGVEEMLFTLKATSTSDETVTVTFPEGYSVYDIAEKLEKNEVCGADIFLQTLKAYDFDYGWLDDSLRDDDKRIEYLEGYLFPDTYEFFIGETPSSVINKMLKRFDDKFTSDDIKRCKEMGLTVDEVVRVASIIQKEAANSKQMKTIASVLYNRINNPSTYPKLECDSTTFYIKNAGKKIVDKLSKTDTSMRKITYYSEYYDTYSNNFSGLPAGAICCPGYDAINAALHPKSTNYYYFAHDDNGKLYTASTISEHEQNLRNMG